MGGAQRAVTELANELITREYKVIVAGVMDTTRNKYHLDQNCALLNLNDWFSNDQTQNRLLIKLRNTLTKIIKKMLQRQSWWIKYGCSVEAWSKLIREVEPDIIISSLPNTFVPLSLAVRKIGIPNIIYNHSNPWKDYSLDRYESNPQDLKYRLEALEYASLNIVLQPEFKNFFSRSVQSKTFVIPNIVKSIPRSKRAKPELNLSKNVILCAGRLEEVKDHKTLIRSFKKINSKFPDWQIKIFGEGSLQVELDKLIHMLNLQNQVFLCGYTSDIWVEYQSAQIFAMPSIYEGWGLALSEAMAYGLPAIGFDNASGINNLIVHGKTGILADGNNKVDSLSEGLEHLMQQPTLRKSYGESGAKIVSDFSREKILSQWQEAICKALG